MDGKRAMKPGQELRERMKQQLKLHHELTAQFDRIDPLPDERVAAVRKLRKRVGNALRSGGAAEGRRGAAEIAAEIDRISSEIRRHGLEEWDRRGRPVAQIEFALHPNHRWQADHSRLNIWTKSFDGGEWVPRQVWLTCFLDAASRAITGISIQHRQPDTWGLSRALLSAVRPKATAGWVAHGIPDELQTDNGTDFVSTSFKACLAGLGIQHKVDPPYSPKQKGRVERWFRTLNELCLSLLPGHMAAIGTSEGAAKRRVNELLTLDQLRREVERWIVEDYHQSEHGQTQRKPGEHWIEEVHLRPAADVE